MTAKTYSEQSASVRNAYCAGDDLVLRVTCSLPDVCVACGSPAWGNVANKEFEPMRRWLLPTPFDIIGLLLGTRYVFAFPFCPSCEPEHFQLRPVRLDGHLAVFTGASKRLLDSLPLMPDDVAAEKNCSWFERHFRWLYL